MNEKLSLQDLVDLLSKRADMTKKDAESFFREFFRLILERIFENDLVKIKDFGTFKLTSINSRESINVNTGEKIEIPPHYKLSFVPDKSLKELVNKPFAQFETVLMEDEIPLDPSIGIEKEIELDNTDSQTVLETKNIHDKIISPKQPDIRSESVLDNSRTKPEEAKDNKPETENKEITESHSQTNRKPSTSFVYTYTTTEKEKTPDSVILTVPKSEPISSIVTTRNQEQESSPLNTVIKDKFPPELEKKGYELTDDVEDTISEEEIPVYLENSPLHENENTVADPMLRNLIADDFEIDIEDVSLTSPVEKQPEKQKQIDRQEEILASKETHKIDDEYLDRPLLHLEKKKYLNLDNSFVPIQDIKTREVVSVSVSEPINEEDAHSEVHHASVAPIEVTPIEVAPIEVTPIEVAPVEVTPIEVAPVEVAPVEVTPIKVANKTPNLDKPDDIDYTDLPQADYRDLNYESKFKKGLPFILFFLIIISSLAFGLFRMLKKPYDFESKLGQTNLTLSDTLPFVDEREDIPFIPDSVTIKSIDETIGTSEVKKDTVKAPVAKAKEEPVKATETSKPDSPTVKEPEKQLEADDNSFYISKKLKFSMLNKAEDHLSKAKKETPAIPSKNEVSQNTPAKRQYTKVKNGSTLRSIAGEYYGNAHYWVYIYQANKKIITSPGKLPLNAKLVIPPLSEYGISDPKNPESIDAAKKLGAKY